VEISTFSLSEAFDKKLMKHHDLFVIEVSTGRFDLSCLQLCCVICCLPNS